MLTVQQALKSKVNWTALVAVALPSIYQLIMTDPAWKIPENIHHAITTVAGVLVIIWRTIYPQISAPDQPQEPPKS